MWFNGLVVPVEHNHFGQITIDAVKIFDVMAVNIASSIAEQSVHYVTVRIQSIQDRERCLLGRDGQKSKTERSFS